MMQKVRLVSGVPILVLAILLSAYLLSLQRVSSIVDWEIFYSASSLPSPYEQFGFLNPYWLKFIIYPFNLVSMDFGFYLFIAITILIILYLLREESKYTIALVFLSPFFLPVVGDGQIDTLVVIGYILLKQDNILGIPLILIKPQILLGSVVAYFLRTTRTKKIEIVIVMSFLFILGIALYGNWIADMINNINNDLVTGVDISYRFRFPLLGVVLLVLGIYKNNLFVSGLSMLFITPYLAPHSLWVYWVALLLERPNWKIAVVVLIASWVFALSIS